MSNLLAEYGIDPESSERTKTVRVDLESLTSMLRHTLQLREQVNELQARGTEMALERQAMVELVASVVRDLSALGTKVSKHYPRAADDAGREFSSAIARLHGLVAARDEGCDWARWKVALEKIAQGTESQHVAPAPDQLLTYEDTLRDVRAFAAAQLVRARP